MTETTQKALEILNRPFHGGSRVTNCVVHMNKEWHDRPKSCENCVTDMANTIAYAIRVNEFLNQQVDDAKAALATIPAGISRDDFMQYIAKEMHYPKCWDTMAYPTIYDAVQEIAFCSTCMSDKKVCLSEIVENDKQPAPADEAVERERFDTWCISRIGRGYSSWDVWKAALNQQKGE